MSKFTFILDEPNEKEKRTWHYIQNPREYEIKCDKCDGTNIEWSEYVGMIWCYDCKIDTRGTGGVFDGPIPVNLCKVLGMSFDRWDMVNKRVLTYDEEKKDYVPKEIKKKES